MMNREQLGEILAASLDPRKAVNATVQLDACAKIPGFYVTLYVNLFL